MMWSPKHPKQILVYKVHDYLCVDFREEELLVPEKTL